MTTNNIKTCKFKDVVIDGWFIYQSEYGTNVFHKCNISEATVNAFSWWPIQFNPDDIVIPLYTEDNPAPSI